MMIRFNKFAAVATTAGLALSAVLFLGKVEAQTYAAATNSDIDCYVVPNASFENTVNRKPANWTSSSWGGSQARYTPEKPGYNSDYAGKIAMYAFVPGTSAKLRSDAVDVPASTRITVSLYAKGTASGVQLQVVQLNANKQAIAHTWLNALSLNSNESVWGQFNKSFYTLPNTRSIQLEILVKSSGTVYFDDVWIGQGSRASACTGARGNSGNEAVGQPINQSNNNKKGQSNNVYRWIKSHPRGGVGNVWISEACANQLDATVVRGSWNELNAIAPRFDSIASPCNSVKLRQNEKKNIQVSQSGYLFIRTDKKETRWVDVNTAGETTSEWISEECASRLGGIHKVYGNWFDLIGIAPKNGTGTAPC